MQEFRVVFPKGVAFRQSPNLDDRAAVKPAKHGEVLDGHLVQGGEWFELGTGEGLFLPLRAPDGTQLLRAIGESGAGGAPSQARPGSGGKFVPWQGVSEEPAQPAGGLPPRPPAGGGRCDELAALDAKYDKKQRGPATGGRSSGRSTPNMGMRNRARSNSLGLGQLVDSHDRTTAYMHEFRDALEDMGMNTKDDPYLNRYAPVGGAVDAVIPSASSRGGGVPRGPGVGRSRPSSVGSGGGRPSPAAAAGGRAMIASASGRLSPTGSTGSPGGGALALCGAMVINRSEVSGTEGRWGDGPQNAIVPVTEWRSVKHGKETRNHCDSGRVIDVSDRNVLCMSVLGDRAVLGSADHGLVEVDVAKGRKLRTLYSKRCGHSEWVTTVSHCPDGRVLSGGADSKLCLWNASGVVCVDLTGHMGSISKVRVDGQGRLAVSAAYDRTLGVWDLRSKTSVATCTGHNAPVLDFVWWDNVVASGDRSGVVKLWDTASAQNTGTLKGHKGHITSMLAMADGDGTPTILSGAQDGTVRVWDLRQRLNTFTMDCHPGGAVNDLGATLAKTPSLVVSTGADGRVLVLEPRSNYRPLFQFEGITNDFLYNLLVLDAVAFTGDGRGIVTCFDLQQGQRRYALSAGENAIRCLGATASSLICSGDDGNAIIFDF
eukprot:TRINITY_DN80609_c0_g1_i1.p1 TRINITY_DN80609_c0_g1~~TRINITY_DN80609_c0_g1_i1.p1  ORF type:complete len:657 (+),score=110.54 TRINITY_DN80609_c0_g1_i1:158-2128(+)